MDSMIGPISNSYTSVQWPSDQNRARSAAPAEAASPLAHKPADVHSRQMLPQEAANRSGQRTHCNKHTGKAGDETQCPFEDFRCAALPAAGEVGEVQMGSMGSRHGEMKVMIPSRNEITYCILRWTPFQAHRTGASQSRPCRPWSSPGWT